MELKTTTLLSDGNTSSVFFKRWRKDENGGMIIFSLFMFVLILWFGGMAVDLMRFETTRAKLQATLDRATLAAADLDQTLSCQDVVSDYFAKAGMSSFLGTVSCDIGTNYRIVGAEASAEMPLFFYDLPNVFSDPFNPNVSTLTVSGGSAAEERVTDVEISMVLDVSGSMGSNSRIENLRPAAREFVSTVLANNTNSPQGLITISVVPYSAVVSVGSGIAQHLNINRTHGYSTCVLFNDDDYFETTEIDLTETFDHVGHFDPGWYGNPSIAEEIEYPWCHEDDHNAMIVMSSDEGDLHDAIDALEPYGNTAIDLGVKWGVALLDPSSNDLVQDLITQTNPVVESIAGDRPQSYDELDVLKVVVVMTDGQNTSQYDMNHNWKTADAPVWYQMGTSIADATRPLDHNDIHPTASIQYQGTTTETNYWDDMFYWNSDGSSRNYPQGFSSQNQYVTTVTSNSIAAVPGVDQSVGATYLNAGDGTYVRRASYHDIFAHYTRYDTYRVLFWDAYQAGRIPFNNGDPRQASVAGTYYALNTSLVNSSTANSRLSDICAEARDAGVIVYTVAFEAPPGGQSALLDCASSNGHYFDVAGTDISEAFQAIASNIASLRLIQ